MNKFIKNKSCKTNKYMAIFSIALILISAILCVLIVILPLNTILFWLGD